MATPSSQTQINIIVPRDLGGHSMDSLIRRAAELHSSPGVARSVLEMTRQEDFGVEELVTCIEMDPALTARVLATINSVRYGLTSKVTNLRQAINLLGRRSLRTIALAFSVVDAFANGVHAQIYMDYWRRSLTTSWVAHQLSLDQPGIDANDAYTAGLLADLGVLVLAQFKTDEYLPLYQQNAHGTTLADAERNFFGFDHAELSARLLETWQFPPLFSQAIAAHHDEDEATTTILSRVVRAGNLMPGAIWIAESEAFHAAFSWFQSHFDFDIERFVDLAFEVNRAVADEAVIYQVKGLEPVDFVVFEEEARQLVEAAACQGP